jgi:hypothetical protein
MKICFCLHDHQPVGNFEFVMESAYSDCYSPMIDALHRHPGVRTGLHLSGTLLEWLEKVHPEFIEGCSVLCREGRMELLTGGRYEPVLTVFRRSDIAEQIRDFSKHLQDISGSPPRGLWLTERVWEPRLASVISNSGVEWAVVDDIHLRRAGASGRELYRPCVTEDSGRTLRLLASDMKMRYMIPFSPVDEVMEQLRKYHKEGIELVFYGDDGEKFGVWPGTRELCYDSGWLDRFFAAVGSQDWLDVVLPSEAAALPAAGPFYVPACSYPEMGEWTVHENDREDYGKAMELLRGSGMADAAEKLLTGGFWRNFLSFYPESKELHGRILSSEKMIRSSGITDALHHFWRSQCNCAFWHGVFGGIYLPHLREAVWREINLAEQAALVSADGFPMIRSLDLNADGLEETVIATPSMSMIVHPERGVTVSQLTYIRPDGEPVTMGNVLSRRSESYHSEIPGSPSSEHAGSIHGSLGSKEAGLSEKVMVDRWRRVCFTELVMPAPADYSDWERCRSDVSAAVTCPDFSGPEISSGRIGFRCASSAGGLSWAKELFVGLSEPVVTARTEFAPGPGLRAGTEVCLNLMTGSSPDRFFRIDGGEERLMSAGGRFKGRTVEVTDRWRRARATMDIDSESDIWVTPLESVNRSESGFESVHQGTAFFISRIIGSTPVTLEVSLEMKFLDQATSGASDGGE